MVEADMHLTLFPKLELDISKLFEPLTCCLKGIWVHPNTNTQAKLAQDFGLLGHLLSGNDAITSWLRLISTSDCFPHPYKTYTMCLSHEYAVSRAYGCTLVSLYRQRWPQILEYGSFVEWKWCNYVMVEADIHLRLLLTSILDIQYVFEVLFCCLKGIWVHPYTITLA